MGKIRNGLKKEINDNNRQYYQPTSGTILSYDKVNNVAKISFINPYSNSIVYRSNVPVSNNLGGLSNNGIYIGQKCSIVFIGGNLFSPLIIGILSSTYNYKTTTDQGAYHVDEEIKNIQKPSDITPMIDDWIDVTNTNELKYDNDISQYTNYDMLKELIDMNNYLNKYTDTEIGLTHLINKSTIKIKDNGDIDLFVSNDTGIRISKSANKVYIYGEIVFNK